MHPGRNLECLLFGTHLGWAPVNDLHSRDTPCTKRYGWNDYTQISVTSAFNSSHLKPGLRSHLIPTPEDKPGNCVTVVASSSYFVKAAGQVLDVHLY